MKAFTKRCAVRTFAALLASAVVFPVAASDEPAGAKEKSVKPVEAVKPVPSRLAKQLVGAWVLVGRPGEVGDPPVTGGRYKFFTGRHWTVTQAEPHTGKVVFHHGGTYTLDGDTYTETFEYANANTARLINRTLSFKIKVKGDTYTQIGIGDDNPYHEVWKRAK